MGVQVGVARFILLVRPEASEDVSWREVVVVAGGLGVSAVSCDGELERISHCVDMGPFHVVMVLSLGNGPERGDGFVGG